MSAIFFPAPQSLFHLIVLEGSVSYLKPCVNNVGSRGSEEKEITTCNVTMPMPCHYALLTTCALGLPACSQRSTCLVRLTLSGGPHLSSDWSLLTGMLLSLFKSKQTLLSMWAHLMFPNKSWKSIMYLQKFSISYFLFEWNKFIADKYLEVEQGNKKRSSNTENKYLSLLISFIIEFF